LDSPWSEANLLEIVHRGMTIRSQATSAIHEAAKNEGFHDEFAISSLDPRKGQYACTNEHST
jgi:hypothetical protein